MPLMRPRHVLSAALLGITASFSAFMPAAGATTPSHRVREGSIGWGQSADALDVRDQSGTQDTWNNYVEFAPAENGRHVSVFVQSFDEIGDSATIDLNFRGPESSETRWLLRVRNYADTSWENVFINDDIDEWTWTPRSVTLDNPADYLNPNDRMVFVWVSNNDLEPGQLDHFAVTMSSTSTPVGPPTSGDWELPPTNAQFDYQISQAYTPPNGVSVVSRDWFDSAPLAGGYSICYVNAFQTQPDGDGSRPDEKSQWPQDLLLLDIGDDPNWGGEYLIDLSTANKRTRAAQHIEQMIDTCANKGFDAVEFDNLDSWGRFSDEPNAPTLPFGEAEAVAFAELITDYAHSRGLAVGQKNTVELTAEQSLEIIGFDFAIAEECGQWNECNGYAAVFGANVVAIEYSDAGFSRACASIGASSSVVRRDVNVTAPGSNSYVYDEC